MIIPIFPMLSGKVFANRKNAVTLLVVESCAVLRPARERHALNKSTRIASARYYTGLAAANLEKGALAKKNTTARWPSCRHRQLL